MVTDEPKLATLARVARALNKAGAVWAVGASAMLYFEGLVEAFNDFDLLIFPEHLALARGALDALGAQALPQGPPSKVYASENFCEYSLDGVDFDLLCNFAVRRKDEKYAYRFDENHLGGSVRVHGVSVPLSPLADWFVLYMLMPGRMKKAELIAHRLIAAPAQSSRARLNEWLSNRLPGDVRERVYLLYVSLGSALR